MFEKLTEWLDGWVATLRIAIFNRPLYRFLRDYEFKEEDFEEVHRPE